LTLFLYPIPWGPKGAEPFRAGLLYNANFVQALFYLTLLVYVSLPEKHRYRHLVTGLLLGLTFLGHAGPFLVLSVFFAVELARDARRDPRGALRRYGLLFAMATLAAAPLLVSIVGRYHLKVQNPVPMDWMSESTTAAALWRHIGFQAWAPCLALLVLWIRGPRTGAWVVTGWIGSALALVGYSFAATAFGWPTVLPRHHLVGYVQGAQPVLFGYGVSVLWSIARQWLDRRGFLAWPKATSGRELRDWVATTGAAGLVLLAILPGYVKRASSQRTGIVSDSTLESGLDAYRWMRSVLHSDDVVLSTDDRALTVTGPAGAKAVVVHPVYSNPYVDCDKRLRAHDEMFSALRRGDAAAFEKLAREYSVTYVLWIEADGPGFDHRPFPNLAIAFDDNRTRIYRRMAL
jgi:hypothetical protein